MKNSTVSLPLRILKRIEYDPKLRRLNGSREGKYLRHICIQELSSMQNVKGKKSVRILKWFLRLIIPLIEIIFKFRTMNNSD
jgi:D-mannonate dehydratase